VPIGTLRIILGLPFLLFFPGYSLLTAIFVKIEKIDRIEIILMSIVISIVVVALIGFGWNYIASGIKLESILYSLIAFIHITSSVAMMRRMKLITQFIRNRELHFRFPRWRDPLSQKFLSLLVAAFILLIIGLLSYVLTSPKNGEQFSEVYILGCNGQANNYPSEFIMENNQIIRVQYGDVNHEIFNRFGTITLGIVNHYQQNMTYSIALKINDEPAPIYYKGNVLSLLKDIEIQTSERWETEIGFAPQHIGDSQKVEIFVFKGDGSVLENSLHIWVNVRSAD
jgi:uncharacterized membrane protein